MIAKAARSALMALGSFVSLGGALAADTQALPWDGTRPGNLVWLPDGRRLNMRCAGEGAPTVLLEGGFAADSMGWMKVVLPLAKHHRVCAYDRAGYGFSDEGPMPRDGSAVADDLENALGAARIKGPYILVGHSAGGLYLRIFAARQPRSVAGMVLADPSVPFQDRRFAEQFGPGAGSLQPLIDRAQRCLDGGACPTGGTPAAWRTQISELKTLWTATSEEVARAPEHFGDRPIIVLTAGNTYASAPPAARPVIDAFWSGLHKEVAALSTRGEQRVVDGSSHMMMQERPDAIVAAVEEVARTASPEQRPQ